MLKHCIVLPGGETVSSGQAGRAIEKTELTWSVNSGEELTVGSVCAAMAELSIMDTAGVSPLCAGDTFLLYQQEGDTETLLGTFVAEKPVRCGQDRFSVTAYDRICLLDKNMDAFLDGLDAWPYTLRDFVQETCSACDLTLAEGEMPNADFLVEKFEAPGCTGRQLLSWASQVMGCFCYATAQGELAFSWYRPSEVQIGIGEGELPFYAGTLSYADYTTAPIGKVQLRQSSDDVGVVFPNDGGENAYVLSGNPLLSASDGERLRSIAESLYARLSSLSYTPCEISIPATQAVRAGDAVQITDANGEGLYALVMTKVRSGQKETLRCTGSAHRGSVSAVNFQSYASLAGKVLELRTEVSGLRAENRDATGKMAALSLTVDGLQGEVSRQDGAADALRTELTRVEQSATALTVQVQRISEEGTQKVTTSAGYTFDDNGLHIRKSGEEMENRLDHTGMYVERSGEVILSANASGVVAADVSVRNYLNVGSHARFEDYEGGTGCYFL